MTAPASFKQADVTRLVRGAVKAGLKEEMIRLTVGQDGSLSLYIATPADNDDLPGNSWDDA